MEKIKPKAFGHLVKHYLRIVPLAAIFIVFGIYVVVGGLKLDPLVGQVSLGAGIIIMIFGMIRSYLYKIGTTIYFDDESVIYETGILTIKKNKLPIDKVTDSLVTRSISERIFGLGTISINTSGGIGFEIMCEGLGYDELNQFHEKLYSKINKKE